MRLPLDRYYTPPELAREIVRRFFASQKLNEPLLVLDPCVGEGAFANAVREQGDHIVHSMDLDPEVGATVTGDFMFAAPPEPKYDLIISNPPFRHAQPFVERALELCSPTGDVVFLLPLQFLGSMERRGFFEKRGPSEILVVRPRPSFVGKGTDFREYAVFRWSRLEPSRDRFSLTFLDWKKPVRKAAKAVSGVGVLGNEVPAAKAAEGEV